ncbi:MAG: hypothetical protein AB7S78_00860 [Candidatus Omnitrophota bacterium]
MELTHSFFIISVVYVVIVLIALEIAWSVHVRRWYHLLLVCGLTGTGLGVLLTGMSGMMNASRFPVVMLFIGMLMGMIFGLIYGGLCMSVIFGIRRLKKPDQKK